MPTADQKSGRTMGRTALMGLLAQDDLKLVLRELLSSAVLKEDFKAPDPQAGHSIPNASSIPNAREVVFTNEGGMAVRLYADENLAKGDVVTAGAAGYGSCKKHIAATPSDNPPFGVVFDSVLAGDLATIVVSGLARVKLAADIGGGGGS